MWITMVSSKLAGRSLLSRLWGAFGFPCLCPVLIKQQPTVQLTQPTVISNKQLGLCVCLQQPGTYNTFLPYLTAQHSSDY